jgi:carboxymethylenebutenolidase
MRQDVVQLYDDFTHDRICRRVFMDRLTAIAGSTAAALMLIKMVAPNRAKAAIVPPERAVHLRELFRAPESGP